MFEKLSKKVASTAIVGAIINIIINVLFIKKIGLYAASLSTMISYLVMAIYRHYDIKKYANIKIDKKMIIEGILIYAITIIIYYQKNIILKAICLVVVCIYAYLSNKSFLKSSFMTIVHKLKR